MRGEVFSWLVDDLTSREDIGRTEESTKGEKENVHYVQESRNS